MEMTENQILSYLHKAYPRETTACEWKQFDNLTHSISGSKGNDLISYVSAIANMNGGFFVMGVEDGLHSITGIKNTHDYTPENLPFRLIGNCTNLSSEGLSIEELIASDSSKKVWIVHIPKHQPRKPVYAHKTAWQRQGDSLTALTKERGSKASYMKICTMTRTGVP